MILESRIIGAGRSVCLITSEDNLVNNQPKTRAYGEIHNLKEGEHFATIPSILKVGGFRNATGFLIGDNRILTARHVIKGISNKERGDNIKKLRIIFNYKLDECDASDVIRVSYRDVYRVSRIVNEGKGSYYLNRKSDWCVLELDRKVEPILKLEINDEKQSVNKLRIGQKLIMIGHPAGMPLTAALKGRILRRPSLLSTRNAYFCSLDSFHGNSGSPVFTYPDFELIGLYVSGKPKDIDDGVITRSDENSEKIKQSFISIRHLKYLVNTK